MSKKAQKRQTRRRRDHRQQEQQRHQKRRSQRSQESQPLDRPFYLPELGLTRWCEQTEQPRHPHPPVIRTRRSTRD